MPPANLRASSASICRALAVVSLLLLSSCTYTTAEPTGAGTTPDSLPFADPASPDTTTPSTTETTPPAAEVSETTVTPATTSTLKPQSCVGKDFSINYPEAWYIGAPDDTEGGCLWLSRGSLATISSDAFVPEIAFEIVPHYGDALKLVTDFEENNTVLSDSFATNFNSFPATVFDVFADGTGDAPEESRTRVIVLDLDGKALVATATEATTGDPGSFEETKAVLNEVLTTYYPVS